MCEHLPESVSSSGHVCELHNPHSWVCPCVVTETQCGLNIAAQSGSPHKSRLTVQGYPLNHLCQNQPINSKTSSPPPSHDRTSLLGPRSLCFLGCSYIHKSLTTEVFGHSLNRKLKLSMWMSKTVQALCSYQRAHKPHAAIRKHTGPLQPLESAQTPCSHQSIRAPYSHQRVQRSHAAIKAKRPCVIQSIQALCSHQSI